MGGLYRAGRTLFIDPGKAEFPLRCIFTNEPVAEFSLVKLAHTQANGAAPFLIVSKTEVMINLPLSDTWRRRKIGRWLMVSKVLTWLGLSLIAAGLILPWCLGLDQTKNLVIRLWGIAFGSVFTLVGVMIPKLEDTVDVNCIPRVGFLKSGLLAIDGCSAEFLNELPIASRRWYHGLFGIEAVKIPEQKTE